MSDSKYILTTDDGVYCPNCGKNPHTLTLKEMKRGKPAFYICFDCKFVGEIGVGVVKQEQAQE